MSDERAHEFVEADFGGGEQVGDEEEFGEENEVREGDEFVAENEVRGGEEFGAENELDEDEEESYSVENNGETMSVSSSNKRIKHMSIDRLSALPDSVLIHILSFLNVNEAAVTSVLSKRWRFLWTESHRLIFEESSSETEKIREFVTRIHKTLINRSGSNLEEFEVNFNYDKCFASDVNVWVEYAVKNNVKKLLLLLKNSRYLYRLPQLIYSNSSFTELWMLECIVDPRRTIEWRFLTSLSLEEVELSQHVIDKIFSSCPVLNSLLIGRCWGFSRLEINSQSLDEILVIDIEDGKSESLVEISVPYLRTLAIWQYPNRRQSRIIKVPSVVRAGIALNGSDWDAGSEEVMSNMKELFENLQHVKQLMVGNMCIQLLQSRVGNLEVYASRDEHIIPGTVGLLESPPSLEKLVIQGFEPEGASVAWGPVARSDLHCDLFHLKTVDILDYANPNFGSEPLLALARILLKKAKVLEKMVIDVELEETTFLSGHASIDFIKVAQALLSYPRSSEKAEVILR